MFIQIWLYFETRLYMLIHISIFLKYHLKDFITLYITHWSNHLSEVSKHILLTSLVTAMEQCPLQYSYLCSNITQTLAILLWIWSYLLNFQSCWAMHGVSSERWMLLGPHRISDHGCNTCNTLDQTVTYKKYKFSTYGLSMELLHDKTTLMTFCIMQKEWTILKCWQWELSHMCSCISTLNIKNDHIC